MRTHHLPAALLPMSLIACAAHVQREATVRDLEPRPVVADSDPVNLLQRQSTIDGLVLTLTIDSTSIHLESVVLTKIPSTASQRGTGAGGDRVTAVGFAAGVRVAEASAADAVLNVQEGVGVVRLAKRQVVVALPAPRALDTVEVSAPATGATARLDVRAAYAPYCKEYRPDNKYCSAPR